MGAILLATDGSESAKEDATRAIDAAAVRDATLHVRCIVDRRIHGEHGLSSADLSTIEVEDRGHEFIDLVRARAREADVDVEAELPNGVPEELVVAGADEVNADLIVVGECGDHASGVPHRIAEAADCDVLLPAQSA